MADIPIDIKLPDDVVKRLKPPTCDDIKLPKPQQFSLCLPFGGSMQAIVDVTKAIPDDCSIAFSILLQLPPLMASLGCFIKLLKLAKPLMDFVQAVPKLVTNPGGVFQALEELIPVLTDIVSCFALLQVNVFKFVRDMLHLIAKMLKCVAQTVKSIAEVMNGIEISIQTAEAAGNQALLEQLKCAKDNAQAQADAALGSLDMVQAILAVAEPLLEMAGVKLEIPSVGSAQDAQALEEAANTMLQIGTSIEQIATTLDSLGKC